MSRIALIHAVQLAMQPIDEAFRRLWPEAECANLLDDTLSVDRSKSSELTPTIYKRIADLAAYAATLDVGAIIYTCSAFGAAIDAVALATTIPVLKPNEAMFKAALRHGANIGMIATWPVAVASMEAEFYETAAGRPDARIMSICVPEAMAALRGGDDATHNCLVAEAAKQLELCDAIMLAHFSTSRAAAATRLTVTNPVLTAPDSAVIELKGLLARDLS